jgi:hypothetical protein
VSLLRSKNRESPEGSWRRWHRACGMGRGQQGLLRSEGWRSPLANQIELNRLDESRGMGIRLISSRAGFPEAVRLMAHT